MVLFSISHCVWRGYIVALHLVSHNWKCHWVKNALAPLGVFASLDTSITSLATVCRFANETSGLSTSMKMPYTVTVLRPRSCYPTAHVVVVAYCGYVDRVVLRSIFLSAAFPHCAIILVWVPSMTPRICGKRCFADPQRYLTFLGGRRPMNE